MINFEKIATFDIETVGLYNTYEDLKGKNPRLAQLWEDRCKWLRDRYSNNTEATVDELWQLKSGLHAEYAKVACVSFGIHTKDGENIQSSCSMDEKEVLIWTAKMLTNVDKLGMKLGGHTIERFDVPFLFKRFLINGLVPPAIIRNFDRKPWELPYFDVAKFWSNGTWQEGFTSLDTMTAVFDIASPKAVMQASRVHGIYWDKSDLVSIKNYCEADVSATMSLIKTIALTNDTQPATI